MTGSAKGRSAVEMLLYLYAESPVHAGASDSLGTLDLPIQREATTGYPVIWGQSLKGALRQAAQDAGWDDDLVRLVFGSAVRAPQTRESGEPEQAAEPGADAVSGGDDGGSSAGLLSVGDAQLVALPVPTLRNTFAWVTSGIALARLARKYTVLARGGVPYPVPEVAGDAGAAADAGWVGPGEEVLGPCLVPLARKPDAELAEWAGRIAGHVFGPDPAGAFAFFAAKLRTDLLVVGHDVMPVLAKECTEFTARVQLGEGKTVQHGPFYSEYLPTETILAANLTLRPAPGGQVPVGTCAEELELLLHGEPLQVGGDETLGKGLMWARLLTADALAADAAAETPGPTGTGEDAGSGARNGGGAGVAS